MQQRLLCDGGCPHNGDHHATHYNVRVYDLNKMKTICEYSAFDKRCSSTLSELKAIHKACTMCHFASIVYNDSIEAINYITKGVPDTHQDFIRLRSIVDKIQRQLSIKSIEIKWWDKHKDGKNFADCRDKFSDFKRSAWKARYM